jgi:hypothetical protein
MAGLDHSRSKNGVASLAYAIPLGWALKSFFCDGALIPVKTARVAATPVA